MRYLTLLIAASLAVTLIVPAIAEPESDTKGETWSTIIAEKRRIVDHIRNAYSPGKQKLFKLHRKGLPVPALMNKNVPQEGDFGLLPKGKFLALGPADSAQFLFGDQTIFLRGIEVSELVPGRTYSWKQPFEVINIVEYSTVLGARQRAPIAMALGEDQFSELLTLTKEVEDLESRHLIWTTVDGKSRSGLFVSIKYDFGPHVVIEERPKGRSLILVDQLNDETLSALRRTPGGEGVLAFHSVADRGRYEEGHKYRPRRWSTPDGKFTVEASFLALVGDKVRLRRVDNANQIDVSQSKLSDEDKAYLKAKAWLYEPLPR